MKIIVPLAGPDFVRADGSVKADYPVEGQPLLRHALSGRKWATSVRAEDYSFVMLDQPETRQFASQTLQAWYPGAHVVFLSRPTRGAALTTIGGLSAHTMADAPIIIDLADILYDTVLDPISTFSMKPDIGGLALTFESSNPAYSYLKTDADGVFLEAAEKRVISSNASAGTYMFANTSVLLRAIAHALENEASQTCNGLFYACPLLNGVHAQGRGVMLHPVSHVRDIKTGLSHAS